MRSFIRRVQEASVEIDSKKMGQIEKGLVAYIAISVGDDENDLHWMSKKNFGFAGIRR